MSLISEVKSTFGRISPGTLLFDRYEVLKLLGHGASGTVFSCSDLELGHLKVALKIFPSFIAQDPSAAARLHREIVVGYQINHHHVVRLYDCVRNAQLIGLAMEHVEGQHLEAVIKAKEPLDLEWIRLALTQCCKGLEAIHKAGLLHRDLKPSNILVSDHQQIKITDFGVVGVLLDVQRDRSLQQGKLEIYRQITNEGDVVGTLDYLSPEYLELGKADEQSDIFSLGLVGYELLSGSLPFADLSVPDLVKAKIHQDTPPLTFTTAEQENLCKVITRAVERKPENRFNSATEMRMALEELVVLRGTKNISTTFVSSEFECQQPSSTYQLPVSTIAFPILLLCLITLLLAFPNNSIEIDTSTSIIDSTREVLKEKRADIIAYFTK